MSRPHDRPLKSLRPISFETGFIAHHPGSVLVSFGQTRVLCACTVENRVPPFRVASGNGWLTASYSMLPASTHERRRRDHRPDGRATEIQRLIGRTLRNAVDLDALPQITLNIDCDVLQADGGTRTAAITGGWLALRLCLDALVKDPAQSFSDKTLRRSLTGQVAAVSLGVVDGAVCTDLEYVEDVRADTDLNLVARADGGIVEIQGTAEGKPMTRSEVDTLVDQGMEAIAELCRLQTHAFEAAVAS